jgi:hypothetical protein
MFSARLFQKDGAVLRTARAIRRVVMKITGLKAAVSKELRLLDLTHGEFFAVTGKYFDNRVWVRTDTQYCPSTALELNGTDAFSGATNPAVRRVVLSELVTE